MLDCKVAQTGVVCLVWNLKDHRMLSLSLAFVSIFMLERALCQMQTLLAAELDCGLSLDFCFDGCV